jgi:hypothetical protein
VRRSIRRDASASRIGRARSARAQMRTWPFLIAAAMCSALGSGARRFGRRNNKKKIL